MKGGDGSQSGDESKTDVSSIMPTYLNTDETGVVWSDEEKKFFQKSAQKLKCKVVSIYVSK